METSMENRKGNIAARFHVTTRRIARCGAATESDRGRSPARSTSQPSDEGPRNGAGSFRRIPAAKHGAEPIRTLFVISADLKEAKQEDVMGRGLLLWLLGIPIPIIILIWVLGGLHG
jgi:hypothetical protein